MPSPLMRLREHEFYSPSSPSSDPPGDRFIPTRSLMDVDLARSSLYERQHQKPAGLAAAANPMTPKDVYRRWVEENLTTGPDGKPFRMLPFKSPRGCRRSLRLVDEMVQEAHECNSHVLTNRRVPTTPDRVLNAPRLVDDYYVNLMDWGKENVLALALGPLVCLWKDDSRAANNTEHLIHVDGEWEYPTSIAWSCDGKMLAVGFADSRIELWDAQQLHRVRTFQCHEDRVGSLSWNGHILTSGSRNADIINHDVRSAKESASHLRGHKSEVCGLTWSPDRTRLASGGNDNIVHIWDSSIMKPNKYLHRLTDHHAAIRALAWCPFQSNRLASGGGTNDRCIKIWNTENGSCIRSIDTGAQVCALEWNKHQKEILSAHGYSNFQLSLWAYPSMSRFADLKWHTQRVLHLSQNPDGSTVASASPDETLGLWKVFGDPSKKANDDSDSVLSLKRLHIR